MQACARCQHQPVTKRCSRCTQNYYCNQTCQREDWSRHKVTCGTDEPVQGNNDIFRMGKYSDVLSAEPMSADSDDDESLSGGEHLKHVSTAEPYTCNGLCGMGMASKASDGDTKGLATVWCNTCVTKPHAGAPLFFSVSRDMSVTGRLDVLRVFHSRLSSLAQRNEDGLNLLEHSMCDYKSERGHPGSIDMQLFLPTIDYLLDTEPDIVFESMFPYRFYTESLFSRHAVTKVAAFANSTSQMMHLVLPVRAVGSIVMEYCFDCTNRQQLLSKASRQDLLKLIRAIK